MIEFLTYWLVNDNTKVQIIKTAEIHINYGLCLFMII